MFKKLTAWSGILVLLAAGTSSAADGRRNTLSRDVTRIQRMPDNLKPFPGYVERNDANRTVVAWFAPGTDGQGLGLGGVERQVAGAFGKLVVRNLSGIAADIYMSLDDGVTPFYYVTSLPSGYKFKVLGLYRGVAYLVAAEDAYLYDGFWDWGPFAFVILGHKARYTLLP